MNKQEQLFTDIQSLKTGSIQHIAAFVQNDLRSMIDDGHITIEQIKEAKIEQNKEFDKLIATIESLQFRSNEYFDSLMPVDLTGEQLSAILYGYYFHKNYNFRGGEHPDKEFVENNDFYVFVTPVTARNGYDSDKKLVLTTLKLSPTQYRLKTMNVGQSSSTIELESFPGIYFNSVNFEFSESYHKKDEYSGGHVVYE